ncbi:hypothetical protein FK220_004045 [Flavobacteriaceae bacterium TP-CH-4]|uniref:Uncharacterized protein n=1 Tax=Pelagihabitans pacificus TaxID=2696054 RepID=A0A967ASN1_9FLAO|nr:hypothetical protein [Pelagihabitans pacificus]NHF58495.1 hypothetical protein [Pelagihabitans pacificus]
MPACWQNCPCCSDNLEWPLGTEDSIDKTIAAYIDHHENKDGDNDAITGEPDKVYRKKGEYFGRDGIGQLHEAADFL